MLVGLLWLLHDFLQVEVLKQSAILQQKLIKSLQVLRDPLPCEVRVIRLQSEMLENFLALEHEKATKFLLSSVGDKQVLVFKLSSVCWVAAHQVFSQENAWVETRTNGGINFVLVFNKASDLTGQFFESGHQNWVQSLTEVDVIVLLRVGQSNNLVLEPQQTLAECNVEILREHVHVVTSVVTTLVLG